jgi:hypothetical protein
MPERILLAPLHGQSDDYREPGYECAELGICIHEGDRKEEVRSE